MKQAYDEEIEIDLKEIFYALRRRILAIVAAGLLFGCLACAYAGFIMSPVYTSSSTMLVLTKETTLTSLTDLQIGSQLTKDYSILVTSRPVLTEVIKELDLPVNYKQLAGMVSVSNPDGTRILQISVNYGDAEMAKEIVDQLSETASAYIGAQMEVTPPKIIEKGEVPTAKSSPNVKRMTMLGILAGLVLSAGVVIVLNIMDDTIRSEEDIQKYLGLSTLSSVPDRKDYINGRKKKPRS